MADRNSFLAKNAQDALANTKREQEERRAAMLREQKLRELKQLETQLFYKKEEVKRLSTLKMRLSREAVVRQSTEQKEEREFHNIEKQLKDTETRITQLDAEVTRALADITDKIAKEKAILMEHQRVIDGLEKQKRETESKTSTGKRALSESLSRLLFYKKKEGTDAANAKRVFESGQKQLAQVEQSLKAFTQEATVLENKIRAMRGAIK